MSKVNFSTMTYGDLLDLAKSSPKYVRKVRKMRKRWIKLLERMEADMNTVYKDPLAYEVIVELTNQDLAWPGDFDSIRGELANLMDKLLTVEAFPDEVHELAIALTYMKQVGSR